MKAPGLIAVIAGCAGPMWVAPRAITTEGIRGLCVTQAFAGSISAPSATVGHHFPSGLPSADEFVGSPLARMERSSVGQSDPVLGANRRACREGSPASVREKRQVLGVHRPGAFAESVSVLKQSGRGRVGSRPSRAPRWSSRIATALACVAAVADAPGQRRRTLLGSRGPIRECPCFMS